MQQLKEFFDYNLAINYAFTSGVKPCEAMINSILLYNAYAIGVAIMIPVLNAILLIIMRCKVFIKFFSIIWI